MTALATPEPPPDAVLAAAYQRGDERAAAELVRRHAAAVARFLYSSGEPSAELDDLMQDTFFRAFRALDTWRGQASIRSWLFAIAGNLLRDELRKGKGRRLLSLSDRDIPDRADPFGELAAAEAEQRMRDGLARLPRLQREVFLLRAQEGSDYAEIAAALGTTPGAARVLTIMRSNGSRS